MTMKWTKITSVQITEMGRSEGSRKTGRKEGTMGMILICTYEMHEIFSLHINNIKIKVLKSIYIRFCLKETHFKNKHLLKTSIYKKIFHANGIEK